MKRLFLSILAVIFSFSTFAAESKFGWSYSLVSTADVQKIERAADLLASTPTGKEMLATFKTFPISISLEGTDGENGVYDDEYSVLLLNPALVKKWPEWKLARLLCHELTHAVQHSLGITRESYDNNPDGSINASGVNEFSALSMEVRFWIEIGAPKDPVRDFYSFRREAYLYFPETVRVGWAFSNGMGFKEPVLAWSDERLANYWNGVLASEAAWRKKYSGKFPAEYKNKAVALTYLRERFPKPVSVWLPDYLENLGTLPGQPTANDQELIQLHRLVP